MGLFYIHLDPRYQEVKALMDQKSQYEQALVKASELSVAGQALLTKYNSIPQENIAKLEQLVPDKLNTVKLVTDIDGIGGRHGITIRSVDVIEEKADQAQQITEEQPKPFRTTTISFTFSAKYEDLVAFLRDLEKSLQVIDVKTVMFRADTQGSGDVHEYNMSVDAYWLK